MFFLRASLAVCVLGSLAGCVEEQTVATHGGGDVFAPPPIDESDGVLRSAQAPIIAGDTTYERPEVGWLNGCTATLVAPDVVITAAHCTGFTTGTGPGAYYQFTIRKSASEAYRYTVDRYRSYARALGANDITLMHLSSAVPASVATPAGLTSSTPAAGAPLSVFGYGCTARGYATDAIKRRYDFAQGDFTNQLCPGDSGGPVITDTGLVARINSGYWQSAQGGDIFGDVAANYDSLVAQIEAWGSSVGGGSQSDRGSGGGMSDAGVRDAGMPDASTGGSCGRYAPFPEYTCATDSRTFIRCRPGSTPEYLYCPSSYACSPGTKHLMCYR